MLQAHLNALSLARYCPLGNPKGLLQTFGPYVGRASKVGLLNAAKDLLFAASTRSCGTELLRQAKLHRTRHRAAVPLKGSWAECLKHYLA